MPQAMERSLATPMMSPRFPVISPWLDIAYSAAAFRLPAKGKRPETQAFRAFRAILRNPATRQAVAPAEDPLERRERKNPLLVDGNGTAGSRAARPKRHRGRGDRRLRHCGAVGRL